MNPVYRCARFRGPARAWESGMFFDNLETDQCGHELRDADHQFKNAKCMGFATLEMRVRVTTRASLRIKPNQSKSALIHFNPPKNKQSRAQNSHIFGYVQDIRWLPPPIKRAYGGPVGAPRRVSPIIYYLPRRVGSKPFHHGSSRWIKANQTKSK